MKNLVLQKKDGIALVVRVQDNDTDTLQLAEVEPFVVAVGHRALDNSWSFGHYFSSLDKALICYNAKVDEDCLL